MSRVSIADAAVQACARLARCLIGSLDRCKGLDSDGSDDDGPVQPTSASDHDERVALEVLGAIILAALCATCVYCQCNWLERRRKRRASIQALEEQILEGTERLLSATAAGRGSRLV